MSTRHHAPAGAHGLTAGAYQPSRRRLLGGALGLAALGSAMHAGLPVSLTESVRNAPAADFIVVDGWVLPVAYFLE